MTSQTFGSYLIRVEAAADGRRSGTVTSVQTGERAPFDSFGELARILERWVGPDDPRKAVEEDRP